MHRVDLPVPRRVHVPLHVAVERKRFAGEIEGEVVGIAHAAEEQAVLVVLLQPPDRGVHANARAVAKPRVVELRQELPFLDVVPVRRALLVHALVGRRSGRERRADVGVVADEQHDRTVGRPPDRVRTVIAHPVRRVALDSLDRIHHVVAIRVDELVEAGRADHRSLILPAAAAGRRRLTTGAGLRRLAASAELRGWRQRRIAGHFAAAVRIERRPARIEQAVAGVQLARDDLLALEDPVAVLVEEDARRAAVARTALRDDRPSLRVERDDDVRLGFFRWCDAIDLETWKERKRRPRRERLILRPLGRRWRRLLLPGLWQDKRGGDGP